MPGNRHYFSLYGASAFPPCNSFSFLSFFSFGLPYAFRDAIAKVLYSRLFDWLLMKINEWQAPLATDSTIGIVDFYGFEVTAWIPFFSMLWGLLVLLLCAGVHVKSDYGPFEVSCKSSSVDCFQYWLFTFWKQLICVRSGQVEILNGRGTHGQR